MNRDVSQEKERHEYLVDEVGIGNAPEIFDDQPQVFVVEELDVFMVDEGIQKLKTVLGPCNPADVHTLYDDLLEERLFVAFLFVLLIVLLVVLLL